MLKRLLLAISILVATNYFIVATSLSAKKLMYNDGRLPDLAVDRLSATILDLQEENGIPKKALFRIKYIISNHGKAKTHQFMYVLRTRGIHVFSKWDRLFDLAPGESRTFQEEVWLDLNDYDLGFELVLDPSMHVREINRNNNVKTTPMIGLYNLARIQIHSVRMVPERVRAGQKVDYAVTISNQTGFPIPVKLRIVEPSDGRRGTVAVDRHIVIQPGRREYLAVGRCCTPFTAPIGTKNKVEVDIFPSTGPQRYARLTPPFSVPICSLDGGLYKLGPCLSSGGTVTPTNTPHNMGAPMFINR